MQRAVLVACATTTLDSDRLQEAPEAIKLPTTMGRCIVNVGCGREVLWSVPPLLVEAWFTKVLGMEQLDGKAALGNLPFGVNVVVLGPPYSVVPTCNGP